MVCGVGEPLAAPHPPIISINDADARANFNLRLYRGRVANARAPAKTNSSQGQFMNGTSAVVGVVTVTVTTPTPIMALFRLQVPFGTDVLQLRLTLPVTELTFKVYTALVPALIVWLGGVRAIANGGTT